MVLPVVFKKMKHIQVSHPERCCSSTVLQMADTPFLTPLCVRVRACAPHVGGTQTKNTAGPGGVTFKKSRAIILFLLSSFVEAHLDRYGNKSAFRMNRFCCVYVQFSETSQTCAHPGCSSWRHLHGVFCWLR